MKWEERELVIILSIRPKHRIRSHQECHICKTELLPGDECFSFTIADRKYEEKKRIYTCLDHSHVFNYSSIEDLEIWQQEFLLENRFTNEVWYQE